MALNNLGDCEYRQLRLDDRTVCISAARMDRMSIGRRIGYTLGLKWRNLALKYGILWRVTTEDKWQKERVYLQQALHIHFHRYQFDVLSIYKQRGNENNSLRWF